MQSCRHSGLRFASCLPRSMRAPHYYRVRRSTDGRTDVCRCCASFSSFAGAAFTAKGHLTPIMHLSLTERGWERKKMGTAQQMELASMAQSVMSSLDRSMSAAIANASSSREGKYAVCSLTGTYHIVCRMRYQTK